MQTTAKWRGALLSLGILSALFVMGWSGHWRSGATFAQNSSTDPLHPQETFYVGSDSRSLLEAFTNANIPFYPEDQVTAFPDPKLGIGSVITVTRALPVHLVDGKRSKDVRTWQATVGTLLKEKNIELGQEDRIAPELATTLQKNLTITITRVARTTVVESEVIPYKIVEQNDDSMYRGETKVTQTGKDGQREKKYLLIREDGELQSKTLIANTIVQAVVDKIIKIGTKLKIGRTFSGKSTWYNCCGTKVAMDKLKRGTSIRVTNLDTGKQLLTSVDGCISCSGEDASAVIDLHPSLFQQLGGNLSQGIMPHIRVEEVLN